MTGGAVLEKNGRDVAAEREVSLLRGRLMARQCRQQTSRDDADDESQNSIWPGIHLVKVNLDQSRVMS